MARLLADVAPNAQVHFFDQILSLRPKLAVLFGNSLAMWAMVEARLLDLFAAALGSRAKPALAALETIRSTELQHSAVFAAVDATLRNKREREVFQTVVNDIKDARDERNRIAHRIWCVSVDHPDDLIALNPKSWLGQRATMKIMTVGTLAQMVTPVSVSEAGQDALIYGVDDFCEVITKMDIAAIALALTRHLVTMKDAATRRAILLELEAQPQRATSLEQARNSRRKLARKQRGLPPQRRPKKHKS